MPEHRSVAPVRLLVAPEPIVYADLLQFSRDPRAGAGLEIAQEATMGQYSRSELEDAFAKYNEARVEAQDTGDWTIWAARFTEDANYIEHAYGEFQGRAAISDWICKVMEPFPDMTFPQDWVAFDEDNGAVIFQCQNRLPHPTDPDGPPFQFPNWTRLVYAGNGLWSSEEDVYNPAKDANPVIKAWAEAGGRFATDEKVKMVHATKAGRGH